MTSHETALEAAAKAMCEAWHYAPIGTPDGDREWSRKQDQYRKQAKSAVSAYLSTLSPDVSGLVERLRETDAELADEAAVALASLSLQLSAVEGESVAPEAHVAAGDPAKPLLATRFKLSFDGKGRCTTFRKDQAENLEGLWVWLIKATNGMNYPLPTALSDAVYELRKFFAQTLDWADENGWTDAACQKDRIVDWFGPSDFLEMRQMIERLEALEDQS